MLLIAAAMQEELKAGMDLCREVKRLHSPGVSIWQAEHNKNTICFLKTGVGPGKSAANLGKALGWISPAQILIVGYAGALDPNLQLGSLVAVMKASAFSLNKNQPDWDHVQLNGTFELTQVESLMLSAKSAGLDVAAGSVLSSSYVLGNPEHKDLLFRKFQASIVDMETAFLARVAVSRNIPISCVRAVSDEAKDTFLEPFSHDPSTNLAVRAKKLLDTGMAHTYQEWKNHSSVAKASLSRFLESYL